jgi:hypothetical protein
MALYMPYKGSQCTCHKAQLDHCATYNHYTTTHHFIQGALPKVGDIGAILCVVHALRDERIPGAQLRGGFGHWRKPLEIEIPHAA